MAVSLRPMTTDELGVFLTSSRDGYVKERVAAGDDIKAATRIANEVTAASFPNGEPAAGHLVFTVEHDGEAIGSLWLGPVSEDDPAQYWVWDITIADAHQGHGYGRETMLLAEHEARAMGATALGLNVFGTNARARHLYENLGYEITSIRMAKRL
jgi:ribosomal protein S18 acetylase RimI-like enzyme